MIAQSEIDARPITTGADESTSARQLVNALINQIECGLLACTSTGTLLFANRSARRELASERVLKLSHELVRSSNDASGEFRAALQDAAERRRTRLLALGEGSDRTMVAVMPVSDERMGDRAALVMIGRRTPCSALGVEMLALRNGLTATETRVLNALLTNTSPRLIAAAHGVRMSTIRTQIQSIRNKFGARSIDALLLQVAELPPVTSWH